MFFMQADAPHHIAPKDPDFSMLTHLLRHMQEINKTSFMHVPSPQYIAASDLFNAQAGRKCEMSRLLTGDTKCTPWISVIRALFTVTAERVRSRSVDIYT